MYTDGSIRYELVVNGTLTGATFTALGNTSLTNTDTAATAITGGTIIESGYLSAGAKTSQVNPVRLDFPLVYSSLLNTQDTLTLVLTALAGGPHCSASFTWNEYY